MIQVITVTLYFLNPSICKLHVLSLVQPFKNHGETSGDSRPLSATQQGSSPHFVPVGFLFWEVQGQGTTQKCWHQMTTVTLKCWRSFPLYVTSVG